MIHRELVPGKYQIVRRIGAGGMGVVYEAIHLGLDRRVAVKVIHPQSSESSEARTRFLREARALALLQSEHIVQVLDVDTLPEGDPYMVMEFLEGRDLKRELMKRGSLPVAEAVGYLTQACVGVAAAHGAGIIHRDIKPANIFITNLDGARRAKILDFGVAKFCASPDQSLTGPTNRLGTLLYMSPEQIAGMEASAQCDLWALGVVLFQILTGRSPFHPRGTEGMVGAILAGTAASLHEAREDVPLGLSRVVARCFEKVHTNRFADARELAEALTPFGPREPTVRASCRAPRGSSAPPPAPLLDRHFEKRALASKPPELASIRELITLTHPGLAQGVQRRDSIATVELRRASPAPAQAANPAVLSASAGSKSDDTGSPGGARGRKFATPGGGLLLLGLVIAVGRPLLAPTGEAPAIAGPPASTSAAAFPGPARSQALPASTLPETASVPAAATPAVPEPTSSTARHARLAAPLPVGSARASLAGTSAKVRPTPKPALSSLPADGAAVPLHL